MGWTTPELLAVGVVSLAAVAAVVGARRARAQAREQARRLLTDLPAGRVAELAAAGARAGARLLRECALLAAARTAPDPTAPDRATLAELARGEEPALAAMARLAHPLVDHVSDSDGEGAATLSDRMRRAAVTLEQTPDLLWSELRLVVLTLLSSDVSPSEEVALAARHRPGGSSGDLRVAVAAAFDLVRAVPPGAREERDGVLVPRGLSEPAGSVVTRMLWNEVEHRDSLRRASVLAAGEPLAVPLYRALLDANSASNRPPEGHRAAAEAFAAAARGEGSTELEALLRVCSTADRAAELARRARAAAGETGVARWRALVG